MKKIVFISSHDYNAKRQGGFHVFANLLSKYYDVVFFSYPRSFFIKIRKTKIIEYDNISLFKIRDEVFGNVRNVSTLFYIPPVKLLSIIPKKLADFFFHFTIPRFKTFSKRYFGEVDYFILESNASVVLFESLKKLYPQAKFLYRPSDPMLNSPELRFYHKYEIDYVKKCDFIFMVNVEGEALYKQYIPDLSKDKYEIISNGIDIESYNKKYDMPKEYLGFSNIVSYIGARPAQWDLVIFAAEQKRNINFFVICPEHPTTSFLDAVKRLDNLHFIQGVSPEEVPAYVTNANMIMIPNPTDMYKQYPWGITAKYYQAMYSRKRIVSYSDNEEIKKLGVNVVYNYQDFVNAIGQNISLGEKEYDFDFRNKDWHCLASRVQQIIETL